MDTTLVKGCPKSHGLWCSGGGLHRAGWSQYTGLLPVFSVDELY